MWGSLLEIGGTVAGAVVIGAGVLLAGGIALLFAGALATGVVARLRGDPRPDLPPIPYNPRPDADANGETLARAFVAALCAVVPDVRAREEHEPRGEHGAAGAEPLRAIRLSTPRSHPDGVAVSWTPGEEDGIFWVRPGWSDQESDGTDEELFWTCAALLRDGYTERAGLQWLFLPEAGLWTATSGERLPGMFAPLWVRELPPAR